MADPNLIELPSPTLKSHVVTRLREAIIGGKYRPGERLNESRLARQFGVSRIPVREALMQLQEQGLVMNHPRRGMFVNSLSEEDTQKINSVRIVLEAEAMKLCQARFTREMDADLKSQVERMEKWQMGSDMDAASLDLTFHRSIWGYSGNAYLVKSLDALAPIVLAHHVLDGIGHDLVRWRLNHHRALLEVVQGVSKTSPEEAIVMHFRIAYTNPEKYSSFGVSKGNPA